MSVRHSSLQSELNVPEEKSPPSAQALGAFDGLADQLHKVLCRFLVGSRATGRVDEHGTGRTAMIMLVCGSKSLCCDLIFLLPKYGLSQPRRRAPPLPFPLRSRTLDPVFHLPLVVIIDFAPYLSVVHPGKGGRNPLCLGSVFYYLAIHNC